jgi:hypothetical protein
MLQGICMLRAVCSANDVKLGPRGIGPQDCSIAINVARDGWEERRI